MTKNNTNMPEGQPWNWPLILKIAGAIIAAILGVIGVTNPEAVTGLIDRIF